MNFFADKITVDDQTNTTPIESNKSEQQWNILLVDDEQQMHQVTKLALANFEFEGKRLNLLSALSGEEAKLICRQNDNIALALVDVVMESETAGLELVKFIRNDLGNKLTRLVLRTGQAGQAPEDVVIREYDIDDYKEKTELTTQKLKTLLYSMLRSYRDLCLIEEQKEGLRKVIEASSYVQNTDSLQAYAEAVLSQVTSLLKLEKSAFYCLVHPLPHGEEARALTLAATGDYIDCYSECAFERLPELVAERCRQTLAKAKSNNYGDAYVLYTHDADGVECLLYVNVNRDLSDLDKHLLEIYMQNIGLTFENLTLLTDIRETSKELVFNLANAVEARSKETGAHVQRVSLICEKLALLYGLPEQEAKMIKYASPLHDVGKVAIPDSILHKPGKLDAEEWTIMQKHVEYGVEILSHSKRRLINVAKQIAGTHHEKWDGSGYPNQLSGELIPVSGRVAALADVFDALGSKRSYKQPWTDEAIMQEIEAQKGKHFEPKLVELMIDNWGDFIAIRNSLPD
ncbi:DUF3369 domain-containing protein [Vibrio sp. NH-UV-68]|uniref:DUF3369 domain-containing protein n=1 Tax=unclassified Vibrio TaxID=2614977 RepID=UPI0036F3C511